MGQLELCPRASPMREGERDGGCQRSNIAEQFNSLLGLPGSAGKFSVLTWAPFILAAQCCLQQLRGSSCVWRGTAHTAPCPHWVPVSRPLLAVLGADSPMDGVKLPQGCAVEGMIATKSDFILADVSPASLAAQHPACMRQCRIAVCHRSSPWLPIRPFTWGQSLRLSASLQKPLLVMLCWSISFTEISTTCSLSSKAEGWMSHKGSISQPHSWGITFAYRPLPGAFRGLVTNAAWLGMGCRASVSWAAPLLSEKFALCFDHGICFGFFFRFPLCSSLQAPGTDTFISRGRTRVQVGQTVWEKGFAFAAVPSTEQETVIPWGWVSVWLLSPVLKSITNMYEK